MWNSFLLFITYFFLLVIVTVVALYPQKVDAKRKKEKTNYTRGIQRSTNFCVVPLNLRVRAQGTI